MYAYTSTHSSNMDASQASFDNALRNARPLGRYDPARDDDRDVLVTGSNNAGMRPSAANVDPMGLDSEYEDGNQHGRVPPSPAAQELAARQTTTTITAPSHPVDDPATAATRQKLLAFVDMLCNRYSLTDAHRGDMHTYAQLPIGVVARVDIMHRCMQQALFYRTLEKLEATMVNIAEMTVVVQDLETRLDETFKLTPEQQKNVRAVALSLITEPSRTEFVIVLADDVLAHCKVKAARLNLINIADSENPNRLDNFSSAGRRICSSVRNGFRADIRNSVGLGDKGKQLALVPFSNRIASKYRPAGWSGDIALDTRSSLTIKLAILRAFALSNPALVALEEDEEDAAAQEARGTKRKRGGNGRVKKGEDFWSKVEAHLAGLRKRFGTSDFGNPAWNSYITKIIEDDKKKFPSRANEPSVRTQAAQPRSEVAHHPLPGSSSENSTLGPITGWYQYTM